MGLSLAVQPVCVDFSAVFICGRIRDAIAIAKPLQEVTIAASLAAERIMRRHGWFAARGAALVGTSTDIGF